MKSADIKKAAKIIRSGGLVGFPTETVYGIAADPENKKAVERLNKIKNRPSGKPYTLHVGFKKDVLRYIPKLSPAVKKTIRKYWPGPLTLILKTPDGRKLGFRMPKNKIALALIRAVGNPVIAPSANVSGQPSPLKASCVCAGLDFVIDGGPTKYGKDSTILDLTGDEPVIVRQGALKIKKQRGGL